MDQPYPVFASSAPPLSAALIVAHPAHELRVFGWMSRMHPLVEVLTTGSRSGVSAGRLARTGELIEAAGGERGGLFGEVLDRDFYALVMRGDAGPFQGWIEVMAQDLVRRGVELVVTDGWQGYSPAHDLTHLMARLAAGRAAGRLGRPVRVVEYAPAPRELAPLKSAGPQILELTLAPGEVAAKRAAIETYPDIAQEAAEIFALEGQGCLRVERLFEPAPFATLLEPGARAPFYERAGEERVRSGLYRTVLREGHLAAVAQALLAQDSAGFAALEEVA